jgi:GNAT superfamily N-acetyltransferase
VELRRLNLSDGAVAADLLELQRRAYRIEADLIGSDGIPPLQETLEELQGSGETFLGALVDGDLAGAVSWRLDGDTLDLHRLVVDPGRFRGGIGTALVRAALEEEPGARRAIVQTGAGNEPAKRLYLREGFEELDEVEAAPGLRVTRFGKVLTGRAGG